MTGIVFIDIKLCNITHVLYSSYCLDNSVLFHIYNSILRSPGQQTYSSKFFYRKRVEQSSFRMLQKFNENFLSFEDIFFLRFSDTTILVFTSTSFDVYQFIGIATIAGIVAFTLCIHQCTSHGQRFFSLILQA